MAETLDVINDLARKDRHRGLRVIGSWASARNPQVRGLPPGCSIEWTTTTDHGLLEHESEVARFKISGWQRGMNIEANPNVDIDVTVEDVAPPRDDTDTLSERTRMWLVVVDTVIESFETTL
jgi:hypothetical protein